MERNLLYNILRGKPKKSICKIHRKANKYKKYNIAKQRRTQTELLRIVRQEAQEAKALERSK